MAGVLSTTSFNFNNVPFDVIVVNNNGTENKAYFFGARVASALGFRRPQNAVARHCPKRISLTNLQGPRNGDLIFEGLHPHTVLITESDAYRLVMRSQLPEALGFQDFVCDTLLPTLRKYGTYPAPPEQQEDVQAIGYNIGIHEDRMRHFENLRCDCEYQGNLSTISSQCECGLRNVRRQARRQTLDETNLLKSGPHKDAGKMGGLATQQKWRNLEIRCENEVSDLRERLLRLEA